MNFTRNHVPLKLKHELIQRMRWIIGTGQGPVCSLCNRPRSLRRILFIFQFLVGLGSRATLYLFLWVYIENDKSLNLLVLRAASPLKYTRVLRHLIFCSASKFILKIFFSYIGLVSRLQLYLI